MIKKILIVFICLGIIHSGFHLIAEEGMWLPHQMKELGLKTLGLRMNPDELYKKDGTGLMSAVVHLGGGTGEFVSSEGLILTNHHVAFGALQRAASEEKDYIQHGFLAKDRRQEIQAYGYHADVLLGYENVTTQVLGVLKSGMSPKQRYDALDLIKKRLVAEAEKQAPDLRAQVTGMYSGNQYFLFRFKRLKDIRIVYAPPRDLGNYGGDIDNWMWPRHTCDFAFLRAYVSPDNVGIDYHPGNIPYRPKSIMKISLDGFKEGDFSFVMGYPGRTYRNFTLSQLQLDIEYMQDSIRLRQDIINFLEDAGKNNREVQIKYAGTIKGLNNYLKNYQGKLEGMKKVGLVKKKAEEEKKFLAWLGQNAQRRTAYGDALGDIKKFMREYSNYFWKSRLYDQITSSRYGSALLSQAYTVYRTVIERQKPDMERDSSYQERNLDDIRQRLQLAEKSYDLKVDRALLKHRLESIRTYPENRIPKALKAVISQGSSEIERYVNRLYDGTSLMNPDKCLACLDMTPDQLEALDDPLINLASELEKEYQPLREEGHIREQAKSDLKKIYLAGLLEQHQGRIAPDANSTIRFTYGFFKGYRPRDAVYYDYQTGLKGVMEKETGEFPFHVPDKLKKIYTDKNYGRYLDPRLEDVPACFLNSTSVTGGNSGSPTINAEGEQIGIIFDMTYESVTADYYIIPELQRTISVDIRYVLFITEKFSGAAHIIREIGL